MKVQKSLIKGRLSQICLEIRNILNTLIKKQRNIIEIKSDIDNLFKLIPNLNEFSGSLVEAWGHICFADYLDNYNTPETGTQKLRDSSFNYKGNDVLLNIKAKSFEKLGKSRINLSSYKRFYKHYTNKPIKPYIIAVFIYKFEIRKNSYIIKVVDAYIFDLLEIPKKNLKIEGSYESSFRVYVSPIPEFLKMNIYDGRKIFSAKEFLIILTDIKNLYLEKRANKKVKIKQT